MASISPSYCHQTILPDDEDGCWPQLSAANCCSNNNMQVPRILARGNIRSLGNLFPSSIMSSDAGCTMWSHDQETVPTPSIPFSMYPERLGISNLVVPDSCSSFCSFSSGNQLDPGENCSGHQDLCDFWEDCCLPDDRFKPLCHALQDMNSGIQAKQMSLIDDSSTKVGRYTVEERKDRIVRFLKKRNQRNFSKTIKYACRKTLADRRVRVRGRFARNSDSCDEDIAATKKIETPQPQNDLCFGSDDVEIKQDNDDEQWLQEAMASLIYLPYISGC